MSLLSSVYIEQKTGSDTVSVAPEHSTFKIDRVESNNGLKKVKVTWQPRLSPTLGSHFFVQYRIRGQPLYESSKLQMNEDNIEIDGLEPNKEYEFRVIAVDGALKTQSAIKVYDTSDPTIGEFKFQSN